MNPKILLVDDDENVLAGFHRVLRKAFDLDVALGGPQALQALEHHGPYAVVVADMQMPGMNGVELLQKVRESWPGVIRLMLTGNQDQRTAIEAINHGQVFRFLTKPCSPEELSSMLKAALRQHELEQAERELLDQTLTGSLKVLMEILSVADPHAFGRAEIVRQRAVMIAAALGMELTWEIGVAAMMAPLGLVTIPPSLAAKGRSGEPLTGEERETLQRMPEFGAQLLARIPRLESVAQIVKYHHKSYAGAGYPQDGVKGEAIPLGARILRALNDFQEIEERRGSRLVALEQMKLRPDWYDPRVLQAMEGLVGEGGKVPDTAGPRAVAVKDLEPGTVLAADVKTKVGMLVVAEGTCLLPTHVEKLQNFSRLIGLVEPLYIKG